MPIIHKTRTEHDITINGTTLRAGEYTRDDIRDAFKITSEEAADVAEDMSRINSDHNKYKSRLHEKGEYSRDMGSMAVGSGAE